MNSLSNIYLQHYLRTQANTQPKPIPNQGLGQVYYQQYLRSQQPAVKTYEDYTDEEFFGNHNDPINMVSMLYNIIA